MIEIVLYVGFIVLADVLAARWIIPIGFGLMVPAGVFAIAPIFTLRDSIHKKYGYKKVTLLVFLASGISFLLSILFGSEMLGRVTIASVVAFLVSENVDTFIYHVRANDKWFGRVMKSNLVSAFLDSVIFIVIAFGWQWNFILGQYVVKMVLATLVGLYLSYKYK